MARIVGEGNCVVRRDERGGVTFFTINPHWLHRRFEIYRLAQDASERGEEIVDMGGDPEMFFIRLRGGRVELRENSVGGLTVAHLSATA